MAHSVIEIFKPLLLIGLLTIHSGFKSTNKLNYPILIDVQLIDHIKCRIYMGKILRTYDIIVDVKNVTQNDVSFWVRSCSWQNNFTIKQTIDKNSYFGLIQPECLTNIPILIHLKSKESHTFEGKMQTDFEINASNINSIKLGFVYIPKSEFTKPEPWDDILYRKRNDPNSLIWNNSISFSWW